MSSASDIPKEVSIREIANEARLLLVCCIKITEEEVQTIAQTQLDRFDLWASNIGVFAQGHASLDHRLRAAPTTKAAVEVELEGLCERLLTVLNGGSDILEDELDEFSKLEPFEVEKFAKDLIRKANHVPGDQVHVLGAVMSVISALHRISLSIRKASNRNSLAKVSDLFDEDEGYQIPGKDKRVPAIRFQITSAFQQVVEEVVRKRWSISGPDKDQSYPAWFREYRDILIGRCVEAIVTRRRQLVYLMSHQVRLERRDVTISTIGPTSQLQLVPQQQSSSLLQVSKRTTNALPIIQEYATSQVDTIASELQTIPIPVITPSEVAPSTTTSSEGGELRNIGYFEFPPPPDLRKWEKEKACPYCCLVLPQHTYNKRKGHKYWRRHLVEDMQPYICLFSHCTSAGKTYSTFTEWKTHLTRPHLGSWTCPLQHDDRGGTDMNEFTYETEAECEAHLSYEHLELDNEQVQDVLRMAGRQAILPRQCFVCSEGFPDTNDIVVMHRHIASHLQAVFILALPWRDDIETEMAVSSNGTNNNTDPDVDNMPNIRALFEKEGDSTSTLSEKEIFANRLVELTMKQSSTALVNSWIGNPSDWQPAELTSHFMVPFGRNKGFVGRKSILEQLFQRVPPSVINDDCQRTVIEGLGGIGKTQVAVEIAYRVYHEYPECSVFWVPAVNVASFDNAYRKIGRKIGLTAFDDNESDIESLVKNALSNEDFGSWLIIIDNADNLELLFDDPVLTNRLPFSRKGSILFTTRNHEVAVRLDTLRLHIMTLRGMSDNESTELLQFGLKESQISNTENTAYLLEFLAYHPLAIKQASAYMAQTGISTTEYLNRCQSSEETMIKLLSQSFEDLDLHNNTIITTWLTSFDYITRHMPLAAQYLRLISALAEEDIPTELLPSGTDELEKDEAIGLLNGYGFIFQGEDSDLFDVHRLVRISVRNWIRKQHKQEEWITEAIQRLSRVFPFPKYTNKGAWLEYLPHGKAVLELRESSVDKEATASLLFDVAESYSILARYEEAEQMHRESLELRNKALGKEHPTTLMSIEYLASVLREQGKYYQAEKMYQQALMMKEMTPWKGPIAHSMNNLALVLRNQGKHAEAKRMYQHALDMGMKWVTPWEGSIVHSLNNLALVLRNQGKHAEAKRTYQHALDMGMKVLGSRHPETLSSTAGLAISLNSEGEHAQAEKLLREPLELAKEALGIENPDTLDSMNSLGIILSSQRKYGEAEEIFQQTLELRRAVLGWEHPHTLDCMNNLANVLYSQGKYDEAGQMQRETIDLRMKALGKEHPDTLISMRNLELIYSKDGSLVSRQTSSWGVTADDDNFW